MAPFAARAPPLTLRRTPEQSAAGLSARGAGVLRRHVNSDPGVVPKRRKGVKIRS